MKKFINFILGKLDPVTKKVVKVSFYGTLEAYVVILCVKLGNITGLMFAPVVFLIFGLGTYFCFSSILKTLNDN